MLKAVILDHFDSFTWNVKSWLSHRFDVEVISYADIETVDVLKFDLVVLSPGPKSPQDYPHTIHLLKKITHKKPVLGICLGMQIMITHEGGTVKTYTPPLHGKYCLIQVHDNSLETMSPIQVARYHSLHCIPNEKFQVIAKTQDEIVMIVKHIEKNWLGFQFHPESFLTTHSHELLDFAIKELGLC